MSDQNKKILHESAAEDFSEEKCFSEAKLLRFIEGATRADETREIQAHLNECEHCAYIVSAVYDYEAHPITEAELQEAQELVTGSPEEQVERLLGPFKKFEKVTAHEPVPSPSMPERVRDLLAEIGLTRRMRWSPAFAVALALFVWAGNRGVRYVQVDSKLAQAEQVLQQEYRPFYEDVRLFGGYGSSGIDKTMGPGDGAKSETEYEPYLQTALAQVRQALAHDEKSLRARQLLAQILIIAEDYARADSLVAVLAPFAEKSPALANDLGVYCFKREDWSNAEKFFALAHDGDPKLGEAYFNLALAKARLGKKSEALALLEKYLPLETDEGWRRAALTLRQTLQAQQ